MGYGQNLRAPKSISHSFALFKYIGLLCAIRSCVSSSQCRSFHCIDSYSSLLFHRWCCPQTDARHTARLLNCDNVMTSSILNICPIMTLKNSRIEVC